MSSPTTQFTEYHQENHNTPVYVWFIVAAVVLVAIACIAVFIKKCCQVQEAEQVDPPNQGVVNLPPEPEHLQQALVESFPLTTFTGGEDVETECGICLEDYLEDGATVICSLPACRHSFHRECIYKWLLSSATTCPICIHNYKPDNQASSSSSGGGADLV